MLCTSLLLPKTCPWGNLCSVVCSQDTGLTSYSPSSASVPKVQGCYCLSLLGSSTFPLLPQPMGTRRKSGPSSPPRQMHTNRVEAKLCSSQPLLCSSLAGQTLAQIKVLKTNLVRRRHSFFNMVPDAGRDLSI